MAKISSKQEGIFKEILIKRELKDLATGKNVSEDHYAPKNSVLKIEKESLYVEFHTGWSVKNEENQSGHFVKIMNFYNSGFNYDIPGTSMSLIKNDDGKLKELCIKNEDGTIQENITPYGTITLNADIKRITKHNIDEKIEIHDDKAGVYAYKYYHNKNDSKEGFYSHSNIPVKRICFNEKYEGGYEVGEGDNQYIIPVFVTRKQLGSL